MFSLFDLLVLVRVPGIGPARLRSLVDHCGSPSLVRAARPEELARAPGWSHGSALEVWSFLRRDADAASRFAERQIEASARAGAAVISLWDSAYPELLSRIYDPPLVLFAMGEILPADRLSLAIVGTRTPSPYGLRVAEALSREGAGAGLAIVSGLARGVDTAAHRAALDASGRTLAVIGSGLDVIYPPENAPLAQAVAGRGALLTEFPMGTKPEARNFPRRNRVISGLAPGTLVVESDVAGGAMITARFALDQNREVFAIPGPAGARMSRGCNALIRDGRAKLVERLEDVLLELLPALRLPASPGRRAPGGAEPSFFDGTGEP